MSIGACLVVFIGHKDQNKQHCLCLEKNKMVINMLVLFPEARKEKRTKHGNDIFQFNARTNARGYIEIRSASLSTRSAQYYSLTINVL